MDASENEHANDDATEREKALRIELEADPQNLNVSAKKGKKTKEGEAKRVSNQLSWEEQYEIAWQRLQDARIRVDGLRKEHIRLTDEAANIRVETHEYMTYMEKKTSKRQSIIVSINDQNQKEIDKIREEERQIQEEFDKQKEELRDKILVKENQLAATQLELNNLDEYRELQQKQSDRIKELQDLVADMQIEHSEAIQQLKAQFLEEKKAFEEESEATIAALSKQAKKEATDCLNKHTENTKKENREMRQELLDLIERTRALHIHKINLEKQRKELVRELQYNDDVRHLRHGKQAAPPQGSRTTEEDRDSLLTTPTLPSNKNRSNEVDVRSLKDGALAAKLHITNKRLT